jgi:DNA-binding response OmpR family regulator
LEIVNPDLLILDIQMPNLDGIELCQMLRHHNQWNYLPILFLTGNLDTKVIQKVFASGADDYINKPVVGAELIKRIHDCLQQKYLS